LHGEEGSWGLGCQLALQPGPGESRRPIQRKRRRRKRRKRRRRKKGEEEEGEEEEGEEDERGKRRGG